MCACVGVLGRSTREDDCLVKKKLIQTEVEVPEIQ